MDVRKYSLEANQCQDNPWAGHGNKRKTTVLTLTKQITDANAKYKNIPLIVRVFP